MSTLRLGGLNDHDYEFKTEKVLEQENISASDSHFRGKCGEIYIENDDLIIICDFCGVYLDQMHDLREHFYQDHLCIQRSSVNKELKINTYVYASKKIEDSTKEEISGHSILEVPKKSNIDHSENKSNIDLAKMLENLPCTNKYGLYPCELCARSFIYLEGLKSHIKRHIKVDKENIKSIKSNAADFIKISEDIIEFHENCRKNTTAEGKYQCEICKKEFTLIGTLRQHYFGKHKPESNPFKCSKCSKTFSTLSDFICHCTEHSDEDYHKCQYCAKQFKLIRNKRRHESFHKRGNRNGNINCNFCSKEFATDKGLKCHQEKIHKITNISAPFKCRYCKKKFYQFDLCKSHEQVMHNKSKKFVCEQCGKIFRYKFLLERHFQLHTKIKPYKCDTCEKSFYKLTPLVLHQRVHTGIKPFKCPHCESAFAIRSNLVRHIDIHLGRTNFKCQFCDKKFIQQSAKTQHERRMHMNDRKHSCHLCDKTFVRPNELTNHLKRHTNIRPYQCDICPKNYFEKRSLNEHMNTHTGEIKYECQICNITFTLRSSHRRHMKKKHLE